MAKQAKTSSGDWTAGIVAITAALLLGGAIPVALYYALYVPRVREREAEEVKLRTLHDDEQLLMARRDRVKGLEDDADEMRKRLAEVEEQFTAPTQFGELVSRTAKLADSHHLRLRADQAQMVRAKVVYDGNRRINFAKGLKASQILVEGQAWYHDLGRFITEIESLKDAVVVVESLEMRGDQNGGYSHNFKLSLYVIERRDLDAVGK